MFTDDVIRTYGVSDFPRILLGDLSSFLQNQVEGASVHVLHANVNFAVTEVQTNVNQGLVMEIWNEGLGFFKYIIYLW
jgi:hypothetical protein